MSKNGFVKNIISGESATVSEVDCELFRTNIMPSLLIEYSFKKIFYADEFGLFQMYTWQNIDIQKGYLSRKEKI